MPSIYQSFLVLYAFLGLVYIILIAPPYRIVVAHYSLLGVGLLILNILTPYLRAVYTILDISKLY